jgi:hypothetical protein
MAVCGPPTRNTCGHCGKEIQEDGPMINSFWVSGEDGYHRFCKECFPKLYPCVQLLYGWKRHFSGVTTLTENGGINYTST